ncbi:MAG: glycosyltransferase family 4 protein [Alistipes sp.]|nr:glycosyltransferase family 4 protein [Alistipes sp.]
MKILYCIAGTSNSGGMERVLANKANYLVQHGYEVVIVTTDQRGAAPFFALDSRIRCIDLAVNYEENNGKSFFNKLVKYPYKQYAHRRRLRKVLLEEKPDITISMYCNEASFLAGIRDGSKKVLEIHFSKFKRLQYARTGLWGLVDRWRTRNDERLVQRYDKFVVLTEEDRGYWGNLPNIMVIPNARTFTPKKYASLGKRRVVSIGRYSHQKGFDRLIAAWHMVAERHPEWDLDIVGGGELKEALQAQIRTLGLEQKIHLVPPTSDIESIYTAASIYVMSSRYEGLPMVLLEAQAFGLPIVSFRCKCGPSDVVSSGVDGFLVEEGNIQGLADGLIKLIESPELRHQMGTVAIRSSARFDEQRIMNCWMELFNTLSKR